MEEARRALIPEVEAGPRELHWKDLETIVDLLFRQAPGRRLSGLGETMKLADLELHEPINKENQSTKRNIRFR
jgi:hypothetical protein